MQSISTIWGNGDTSFQCDGMGCGGPGPGGGTQEGTGTGYGSATGVWGNAEEESAHIDGIGFGSCTGLGAGLYGSGSVDCKGCDHSMQLFISTPKDLYAHVRRV